MSASVVKSIVEFIVYGLGIKVIGFIRSILMANKFGVTLETDSFFFALSTVFIFSFLLGGALTATLIPILAEIEQKEGRQGKIAYLNDVLSIFIVGSLLLTGLLYLQSNRIIYLLSNKKIIGEQLELTVKLFRLGFPTIIFYIIASSYRGFLQSEMLFKESSLSLLPVNLSYIVYLLFLSDRYGITGLMMAQVTGIIFQIVIQYPTLKKLGYSFRFRLDFKNPYLITTLSLIFPVFISIAVGELNAMVDKFLAASLKEGSISALDYGYTFTMTIRTLFISAISTVVFPILSNFSKEGKEEEMAGLLEKSTNYIALIAIPASLGLFFLSNPVIRIIYENGEFDSQATMMTADTLKYYALGISAMSLSELYTKTLYSLNNSKTALQVSVLTLLLNIFFNLILVRTMAHGGLALATSISAILSMMILRYAIGKHLGFSNLPRQLSKMTKVLFSSLVMGLLAQKALAFLSCPDQGRLFLSINLLLVILMSMLIYVLMLGFFRLEEIEESLSFIKAKLQGRKSAS